MPADLYLIRQHTHLPAKMPRITVEKSSSPRNRVESIRWGSSALIIPIENFEMKMDIESIKGIQLPGNSTFFFFLSNLSLSRCIWENPIKNPPPKQRNQRQIGKGSKAYLPKNPNKDQPKKMDGIKNNTGKGTEPAFLAFKPPSKRTANKGHTNKGIFLMISNISLLLKYLMIAMLRESNLLVKIFHRKPILEGVHKLSISCEHPLKKTAQKIGKLTLLSFKFYLGYFNWLNGATSLSMSSFIFSDDSFIAMCFGIRRSLGSSLSGSSSN